MRALVAKLAMNLPFYHATATPAARLAQRIPHADGVMTLKNASMVL